MKLLQEYERRERDTMTYINKEMTEDEVAIVMKRFSDMIAKEKRDYGLMGFNKPIDPKVAKAVFEMHQAFRDGDYEDITDKVL